MPDKPMVNDRYQRMQRTASIHLKMEAKNTLQKIVEEFPNNPAQMDHFYRKARIFTGEEKFSARGRHVVATMCIHVPIELILAAGAIPYRICSGAYATDQIGAEFLPAKSCPLVKATLGTIFLHLYQYDIVPDLIVNPTTCDQKKKLAELSGELTESPFYTLEVPPTRDSEDARIYWQRVVKRFARRLENLTGTKITRRKLKGAIRQVYRAQVQYRRFFNLRKGLPVIWGKDAILVTNTYFYSDIEEWTNALEKLNGELEQRIANTDRVVSPRAPRILLTGSPSIFPNMKVPILVEQLGGIVVAEEFCSSSRLLYDTVAVDEWFLYDMLPAVADRYLKPCTCPNFTPNTDRLRKLLDHVREFTIDGVIYQAFAGCQLYEMESRLIGNALEKNGIPMLYVETDYSPDDLGQISTRIEAFIESLKTRKKKKD